MILLSRSRARHEDFSGLKGPLKYYLLREQHLSAIEPLLHDPFIEDIFITGTSVDVEHSKYGLLRTNIVIHDIEELVNRIAIQCEDLISYSNPRGRFSLRRNDVRFRISIALAPEVASHTSIVIRRLKLKEMSILKLIRLGTLTPLVASILAALINLRRSGLIIGIPSSGKTTLMVSLCSFIDRARLVVVQHSEEIWLPQDLFAFESLKASLDSLEKPRLMDQLDMAILERSPQFILVDDLRFDYRGEEPWAFLQLGRVKTGALATMHAENPIRAIGRFLSRPVEATVNDVCDAVDYMVVMHFDREEHRRLVLSLYLMDRNRLVNVATRTCDRLASVRPEILPHVDCIRSAMEYGSPFLKSLRDEDELVEFIYCLSGFLSRLLENVKEDLDFRAFTEIIRDHFFRRYKEVKKKLRHVSLNECYIKPSYVYLEDKLLGGEKEYVAEDSIT